MFKIGKNIVLHSIEFPDIQKNETDTFLLAIIREEKDVVGQFSRKKEFKGYRAEDENGKMWFLNWESYPDDAASPVHMWYKPEYGIESYDFMFDAVQAGQFCALRTTPKWVLNPKFSEIVGYCEKHKDLYYLIDTCWRCKHNLPEVVFPRLIAGGW